MSECKNWAGDCQEPCGSCGEPTITRGEISEAMVTFAAYPIFRAMTGYNAFTALKQMALYRKGEADDSTARNIKEALRIARAALEAAFSAHETKEG